MVVLVQANVLAVGLNDKSKALSELPIRLVTVDSAAEAVSSFKNEDFDSVVSSWKLQGTVDGEFVRRLRAIRPSMPLIVFIEPDCPGQEIQAASIGVTAILSENSSDELLCRTVLNVLSLKARNIRRSRYSERKGRYPVAKDAAD